MKTRNYIILIGVLLATINCYSQDKVCIACIGNSITMRLRSLTVKQTDIRRSWEACWEKVRGAQAG